MGGAPPAEARRGAATRRPAAPGPTPRRRGSAPAAPQAGGSAPHPEEALPAAAVAAPTGIPAPTESSARRRKGYVIPPGPFPLDPLL